MAAMSGPDMILLARIYARDADTVDPAFTDANYYTFLDQAQQDYGSFYPNELVSSLGSQAFASGAEFTTYATAGLQVRNLVRAEINATGALRGAELEKISVPMARRLQEVEAESGTPRMWAAERLANTDSDWTVYTVPIPSGSTTIKFWGALYPGPLSTIAFCDYGEAAARVICRMAGMEVAKVLGQDPGYIQSVASGLPDLIRNHALRMLADYRPQSPPAVPRPQT